MYNIFPYDRVGEGISIDARACKRKLIRLGVI